MKGPLAATLCAAARFKDAELKKLLFIIVTADEEVQAVGAHMVTKESKLFAQASSGYASYVNPRVSM